MVVVDGGVRLDLQGGVGLVVLVVSCFCGWLHKEIVHKESVNEDSVHKDCRNRPFL